MLGLVIFVGRCWFGEIQGLASFVLISYNVKCLSEIYGLTRKMRQEIFLLELLVLCICCLVFASSGMRGIWSVRLLFENRFLAREEMS